MWWFKVGFEDHGTYVTTPKIFVEADTAQEAVKKLWPKEGQWAHNFTYLNERLYGPFSTQEEAHRKYR